MKHQQTNQQSFWKSYLGVAHVIKINVVKNKIGKTGSISDVQYSLQQYKNLQCDYLL